MAADKKLAHYSEHQLSLSAAAEVAHFTITAPLAVAFVGVWVITPLTAAGGLAGSLVAQHFMRKVLRGYF